MFLTSCDVLHLLLKLFVHFSLTLLSDNTFYNSFSNFYFYLTPSYGTNVIFTMKIGNNTILLFGSNRPENWLKNAILYDFSVECAGFMVVRGRCFLVKKGCSAQATGNTSVTKYYSKSCN